jgi:hypothetical protein
MNGFVIEDQGLKTRFSACRVVEHGEHLGARVIGAMIKMTIRSAARPLNYVVVTLLVVCLYQCLQWSNGRLCPNRQSQHRFGITRDNVRRCAQRAVLTGSYRAHLLARPGLSAGP